MKRRFPAAVAALLLGCLALAGNATAEDKISPALAKPMKEAQQAIQKKQWDVGLKKLAEAEGTAGKTAFDQYQISEFRGYILLQQKKYADVARLYEQSLASVPPAKVNERLKALVQLNSQTGNYPKVIEYGDRLAKAGSADTDTRIAVASAYYQTKSYKAAVATLQDTIKVAEQSGKPVPENWLLMLRDSQQHLGDTAGASKTMGKLVRLYPKGDYWEYLLTKRTAQTDKDRLKINLYRLQNYVGVLKGSDDYLEMSVLLIDSGYPVEARNLLQSGLDSKVFDANAADKQKAQRYLNNAKVAEQKLQQSLPKLTQDAAKSQTGQGDVALGMAYAGLGQYDKAVAPLTSGLKKGGVQDPQLAQMMLGIAQLKAGNKAEAVKTFSSVKDTDQNMVDVAQLWALAAGSQAAPAQEAAKNTKKKA